ncbi:MAG: type II toxin-antitoxin system HicB family antitoxin [Bacteroidales bacterium]|jgi:predicted RNase H-like HicB family nuclease|nr:type II toxin-antitoxin system HicB family antitoxin [Bacteroidales bacterium]MDY6417463.1 type II toxin-antitoxin system HicB family antitoxin [Bacteroidales bacterium]MDY6445125.1 type II toxin-antitoxin system HicB family antitoxin [Bacteroidales bacterium]
MSKIKIIVDYTDNYAACPADDRIACVSTGRTLDEVKKSIAEGLRFHIDGMRADGEPIPAEFEGEWEFEWELTARAMLHYTEGLVPKSAISKATGINQQQLTHYASGYRVPRPMMRQKILDGIHSIAALLSSIS